MGQRKEFYRQRIPESICAREQIIDIDIFATSRICDRENMQICQDNEQTSLEKEEVEQTESVLKTIYQTNTYKKGLGLSWSHFDDETWIQGKKEASEGPTAPHIWFCILPNNSKQQLGMPGQM